MPRGQLVAADHLDTVPAAQVSVGELAQPGHVLTSHLLQITGSARVLDVGCGVATTAIEIARRHGVRATAVDISRLGSWPRFGRQG